MIFEVKVVICNKRYFHFYNLEKKVDYCAHRRVLRVGSDGGGDLGDDGDDLGAGGGGGTRAGGRVGKAVHLPCEGREIRKVLDHQKFFMIRLFFLAFTKNSLSE